MKTDFLKTAKKHWKTIVFILLFISFIITREMIFAIATLGSMIWIVGSEVNEGAKRYGWKHEIVDTVISVMLILIFWFGLQTLLNTETPISAIVTCSMLPNLERGDLVIIQGAELNAYEIEMTAEEFQEISSYESVINYKNNTFKVLGSMYSYCLQNKDSVCNYFLSEPEEFIEKRGEMIFYYSQCGIEYLDRKIVVPQPCITEIEYKDKKYPVKISNDILVYVPEKNTYFSYVGDIIHRIYFKVNVEGEEYYLVKGDNNPILDIQMYDYKYNLGNLPAKNINGKEIFRIPYVGYLKLFISMFFETPEQCNTQLKYNYLT
ncbi:MAG: hypothetical protein PHU63_01810 [Candidatus ainarchaeum sp.]|nr:hypothetical protein [Candidatus ainarchaeum sp.]